MFLFLSTINCAILTYYKQNNLKITDYKFSKFQVCLQCPRAVRQRGPARARPPQDHFAPNLRQVPGTSRLHPQADQQHLSALRLRNREVQRHRRTARDPWQHYQRLCHTPQRGAQAVPSAGAHTLAQDALSADVPPAAGLLCGPVSGEGPHADGGRSGRAAALLAEDVQLQGGLLIYGLRDEDVTIL